VVKDVPLNDLKVATENDKIDFFDAEIEVQDYGGFK